MTGETGERRRRHAGRRRREPERVPGPGDARPDRPDDLDGVLVVRKPIGPTSHDVVALVRRLASTRRVGHGGTLDPFASGVLPLFLGHATRVVEYHMGDRKEYRATVCFGASSATDDLEGELTPHEGRAPSRDAVEAGLGAFRGLVVQVPPAYSAVKVAGRRAYALARAGKAPELAPRTVTIDRLDIVDWDGTDPERPIAIVEVACSAGTYVRALARDLGVALGSGAYLGALERTASGPFRIDAAVPLDDLRPIGRDGIARLLLPVDAGLDALPVVEIDAAGLEAVRRGQRVTDVLGAADSVGTAAFPADGEGEAEGLVRLRSVGHGLVAIGRRSGGWIAPVKVLVEPPAADASRRGEGRRGAHGDA
jgi:tRNA pseudouridine55 synthase